MSNTFDTTPKTEFLTGLASQKWNPAGALAELVDNSFGELRGNAKHVLITYDRRKSIITVLDDGVGMDHVGRLFQLGNTIGRGPNDIGKYGSGGTMAILWLPTEVAVWTMRNRMVMHDRIVWKDHIGKKDFPQINDVWERASLRNTPTALLEQGHGTMIEMKLRPQRSIQADNIQRELQRIYAPGLRYGKVIKWLTIAKGGRDYLQTLSGEPFELPEDPRRIVHFNLNVRHDEKLLPVQGTVALTEGLPYSQSLVSIGFGHRVIFSTRECYASHDGETSYSGSGVGGWLDLGDGWQDYLSTTKDAINDDVLRTALMHHVFTKIEPLLKQTEEDRLSIILDGMSLELTDMLTGTQELALAVGEDDSDEWVPASTKVTYPSLREPKLKPFEAFPFQVKVEVPKPEKFPGEGHRDKPVTRIQLHPVSDADMIGALCRLEILSDNETNLRVEINKELDVIQELLKARPINRMALHLLVTREIASALVEHPAMVKRSLAPKIIRVLDALPDNAQKERKLARILMDSARRPKLVEAA